MKCTNCQSPIDEEKGYIVHEEPGNDPQHFCDERCFNQYHTPAVADVQQPKPKKKTKKS